MNLKNIPAGKYDKIRTVYIPLIEGQGATCENCGRLIANIVTVKNITTECYYSIGPECAKNLFTDVQNKQIEAEVKAGKKEYEGAKKAAEKKKHKEAFTELMQAERAAGIDNTNINSDWAKKIFNEILTALEAKHGFYISFPRH